MAGGCGLHSSPQAAGGGTAAALHSWEDHRGVGYLLRVQYVLCSGVLIPVFWYHTSSHFYLYEILLQHNDAFQARHNIYTEFCNILCMTLSYNCVHNQQSGRYMSVFLIHLQVAFNVTSVDMQVYTSQWEVPAGEYQLSVGGQQPGQTTRMPSNTLTASFTVE